MIDGELEQLKEELRITDALLLERNKVLDAIPPCPEHGAQCVPHALAWIEMAKGIIAAATELPEIEEASNE